MIEENAIYFNIFQHFFYKKSKNCIDLNFPACRRMDDLSKSTDFQDHLFHNHTGIAVAGDQSEIGSG